MGKTYQVEVIGPRGEKQTIDLCNTDEQFKSMTVLQLKEKIARKFPDHPEAQQRLMFHNQELEDRALSSYGIQSGSIINLREPSLFYNLQRGAQTRINMAVTVYIKELRGTTTEIQLHLLGMTTEIQLQDFESATVQFLKTKIRDSFGYTEDDQRLIFSGRQLEDSRLLSSYGIQHESTIILNKRLRGGRTVDPLKGGDGMGDKDGRNKREIPHPAGCDTIGLESLD